MSHPNHLEIVLRLGAAILSGALIGLERQWNKHTAGVRTHALVALGAALFFLFVPFARTPQEAPRMAAQVITGIGFLGAGVLMRTGLTVHGLNTAATVWCTAALGVLCAAADYWSVLIGTGAVLLVNLVFRPVSRMLTKFSTRQPPQAFHYSIKVSCDPGREAPICSLLTQLVAASIRDAKLAARPRKGDFLDLAYPERSRLPIRSAGTDHDPPRSRAWSKVCVLEVGPNFVRRLKPWTEAPSSRRTINFCAQESPDF
jgi:putative Mg2+ transporter-C (MgtC) family protein